MAIMERQVHYLPVDGLDAMLAREKEFDAVEVGLGFPPKRHYVAIAGEDAGTVVLERQWPSLAEYEAAHQRMFESAEWQAVMARVAKRGEVGRMRTELYYSIEG